MQASTAVAADKQVHDRKAIFKRAHTLSLECIALADSATRQEPSSLRPRLVWAALMSVDCLRHDEVMEKRMPARRFSFGVHSRQFPEAEHKRDGNQTGST